MTNKTDKHLNTATFNSTTLKAAPRVPWWMWLVIILCALPGLSVPLLSSLTASNIAMVRTLTLLYPLYVLLSAVLAWQCYGRRSILTWIILVLLILSHACFYYLAFATYHAI